MYDMKMKAYVQDYTKSTQPASEQCEACLTNYERPLIAKSPVMLTFLIKKEGRHVFLFLIF